MHRIAERRRVLAVLLVFPLCLVAVGLRLALAAEATAPQAVSPGDGSRFAATSLPCPTFSWALAPGASGHELVVYAVPGEAGAEAAALASSPALVARVPGRASSWTPSSERCLRPGRYAWSVRARSDGNGTAEAAAAWSEPLLFEVSERPSEAELEQALEVVRRYLDERGGLPVGVAATPGVEAVDRRRELRRDPGVAADRPAVARAKESEEADIPERVESAAGSEPTIVLGGDPVARLAASDLERDSDDPEVFEFHNPGTGTMTLRVDGVDVVTTATDQGAGNQLQLVGNAFAVVEGTGSDLDADLLDGLDSTDFVTANSDPWVDEIGDTMSGALIIDVASGHALETGSGDSIDLGGDVFREDTLFLHVPAADSTGVGLGALDAVTSGAGNTAVGLNALGATTTGTSNTAVGTNAMSTSVSGARNTALGRSALLVNTASFNTAVGAYALDANTSGSSNTAVGVYALGANVSGIRNTAVGRSALLLSTSGRNTAVGAYALDANTTGNSNTAVGVYALSTNATGLGNTAVGSDALAANTASFNTAVGNEALTVNTSGGGNSAIGEDALRYNTTGGSNTAAGSNALRANVTGSRNTAIGRDALAASTANENTAVGNEALLANSSGYGNTAVGSNALDSNTTGAGNTVLGVFALSGNSTGDSNIAIGYLAGSSLTTGNDNIAIGNSGVVGESSTIRIGSTSQNATFVAGIHGATSTSGIAVLVNSSGKLGTATSSRRFKEEIADIGEQSDRLRGLRPVSFRYRPEVVGEAAGAERPLEFGLIAEEVAEVFPELVVYDENGAPYTVRYHLLVPLLLAELQRTERAIWAERELRDREAMELHAEIQALRRQVAARGAN